MRSSYSTNFNDRGRTLTCSEPRTTWAYCYGAPCVLDDKDSTKATCTCPLLHGAMSTLGGDCKQASCSGIWSAAPPDADQLANQKFYDHVRTYFPQAPVKKPAQACSAL